MNTETTSSGVTTIDVVGPLDDGEATELARCEGVIERGVGDRTKQRVMGTARYEIGDALRRIRDGRLFRMTHRSFWLYCRDRWDIRDSRARHMVAASPVAQNPSPTEDEPVSEAQIHPLALPPPDEVSPTPRDEAEERGHATAVSLTHQLQLRADEAAALEQHEAVIARGINTFIEVGTALRHVRDERFIQRHA